MAVSQSTSLFTPKYLLETYSASHGPDALDLISRAFDCAKVAHEGQFRRSGEPYFTHPMSVAEIVAELGMDAITIAGALLHDAVEDTQVSLDEITSEFGAETAAIVDGVTKLDRLSFDSKEAQQAATMRKMLLAMARDSRVLVIKLSDRLHNMRTISALPEWKQRRTAQETMDIYAPLAHRLGIQAIKWQLEDLSFAALHPRRYAEIEHQVITRAPERENYLTSVIEVATERLAAVGIEAEISGRPKHLWSIYEKMVVKTKDFNSIHDIIGMRIITETEKDCWAALGVIHSLWSPVAGRFKDYINAPKFNLYQSLHTTVMLQSGNPLEVQLRTREMHLRAEYGVAAHWGYKEGGSTAAELVWLNRIVDWQKDNDDPAEFLENLKLDLEVDEVYVFTPKGRVLSLPIGATPIDFAYSVHTEVGHRCIGAKVNQKLVPLDSKLNSGDTVEIFTSKVQSAGPSRDWLKVVVTPRARNKIRQWFSRERRDEAIESGREELIKALRKEGLSVQKHTGSAGLLALAISNGFTEQDGLVAAIGEGQLSAKGVVHRIIRENSKAEGDPELLVIAPQRPRRKAQGGPGIYVEGLDDVMVRLSQCCSPVPGDEIVGFITRGRGVSVHRSDCTNAMALFSSSSERVIDVEWDGDSGGVFSTSIEVRALDRARLLADVSRILSEHHVNILSSTSAAGQDRISRMRFVIELADAGHLQSILTSIRQLDSVYSAYRVLPQVKDATASDPAPSEVTAPEGLEQSDTAIPERPGDGALEVGDGFDSN